MRREDVQLNDGATLVILRDGGEHYMRLLVPKDGILTFITPKMEIDPFDLTSLCEPRGFFRCYVGTMLLLVDDHAVTVKLGQGEAKGQRQHLTQALRRIAV